MSALEQLVGNMTVAQLAQAADMDIDAVVALVLRSGARSAAQAPKAAPAKRGRKPGRRAAPEASEEAPNAASPAAAAPARSGGGHNTRTRAGREELDQAILDYLKSQEEPVRALDIRKGIGGTAAQVRTRLNYLIEKNKVSYKGRASGTRYRAK